ncbi:NADH dehydrogenase (ubiquinone) 1 alpha subcomplex 9 [Strigomonas culicis]|uniref:NADH dehydrogenase (Ubiquinone) 1 alpha subcomplex 9 n=1 Tax=Strigomonas culicis TaxID=28005 RepID=S9UAU1_9TRYP|nr:NADH dehydrogenase (ubiquinone) 1 alpha subcomplex 9 [Strigomonas culicis]|eukprot:EPY26058.1 NADH dehydrogenase (ubiquinone) 1 alpha subcomplex 9 [Strigomonas culicis]
MSRRIYTRTMSGQLSNTWRHGGYESHTMGVTVATFGSTGILGSHVHAMNCEHGYTNILPFRFRSGMASGIRQFRCLGDGTLGQNFETDFELDKEFVVKSILEKVDNVVNCIGAWQEPTMYENSQSWFSMEAINVEWPRLLARWCREMGILKLTHMSMVGADLNSPSKLLRQKREAELAVLEEFPTATIIRSTDSLRGERFYLLQVPQGAALLEGGAGAESRPAHPPARLCCGRGRGRVALAAAGPHGGPHRGAGRPGPLHDERPPALGE